MSGAEHPFPWSEDAICRPSAENDACWNDMCSLPLGHDGKHKPHGQPAENDVPDRCTRCHGDLGWYGLHGVWEPCPDCDPPSDIPPGSGDDR